MLGRLKALWVLGIAFFQTLLRSRLGLGKARGLPLFVSNYADDRLVPVNAAQRKLQMDAKGCIACGRCTAGDRAILQQHGVRYPGLMNLVLSGARGTPDFAAAADAWQCITPAALEERERLCPTGVPLVRLRQYVLERAAPPGAS